MSHARDHLDLSVYGIEGATTVYHNPGYEELFRHETAAGLDGCEQGVVTKLGAVAVRTGVFTGRSPRDKYFVVEPSSEKNVWWKSSPESPSDNRPMSKELWSRLEILAAEALSGKPLYVVDGFCGANRDTRIKVRFILEVAWQAHFVTNMFIRPTPEELEDFEPDFVTLTASKTKVANWREEGLHSEVAVAFHLGAKRSVIIGTWYGGEMKKGILTVMNYYLPLRRIASMHCSANLGREGDTAIFFGLSGTGKTTLSTDPDRALIGDDEHGWDDDGVFNFEGGCYAKVIHLDRRKEPDIYRAIRRDALLENVVVDSEGEIDFADVSITENTRVSYPIDFIENIVRPLSRGGHARNVIFLTADAFGVLPPVAILTPDQTQYHFLSGYTSKLAGTERGVREPEPTFSSCYGGAFLSLHPTVYARELVRKIEAHGTRVYLVNTGWIGGPYGVGKRIDIDATRSIVRAILSGALEELGATELNTLPIFKLAIPRHVSGVEDRFLNPRNAWKDPEDWDRAASDLARRFIENFRAFTDVALGRKLLNAGPSPAGDLK